MPLSPKNKIRTFLLTSLAHARMTHQCDRESTIQGATVYPACILNGLIMQYLPACPGESAETDANAPPRRPRAQRLPRYAYSTGKRRKWTFSLTAVASARLDQECQRRKVAEGPVVYPARVVNDLLMRYLPPAPGERKPDVQAPQLQPAHAR